MGPLPPRLSCRHADFWQGLRCNRNTGWVNCPLPLYSCILPALLPVTQSFLRLLHSNTYGAVTDTPLLPHHCCYGCILHAPLPVTLRFLLLLHCNACGTVTATPLLPRHATWQGLSYDHNTGRSHCLLLAHCCILPAAFPATLRFLLLLHHYTVTPL